MAFFQTLLGACSNIARSGMAGVHHYEDASEMQLNAFEFRNFKTTLEPMQQRLLERIVNQWCVMLVKGKMIKVNEFDEKVYLDKDLLTLTCAGDTHKLRNIIKMELYRDTFGGLADAPWGLEMVVHGSHGEDTSLRLNFPLERHRLNFALTLRILRSRDPLLDPSNQLKVMARGDREEDETPTLQRVASSPKYAPEAGIPVVFSVGGVKILQKLSSVSKYVFLEFFVKYPRTDTNLYVRSQAVEVPSEAILADDAALRRTKEKKENADEEEAEHGKEAPGPDADEDTAELPICTLHFHLKNAKLKVPRVPHRIFGRLTARDELFPAAIGTFEMDVRRAHLQDRRQGDATPAHLKTPEVLTIRVRSASKVLMTREAKEAEYVDIAQLTVRLAGFVTVAMSPGGKRHHEEEHGHNPFDDDGEIEGEERQDGEDEEEGDGDEEEGGDEEGGDGSGSGSGGDEGEEGGSEEEEED